MQDNSDDITRANPEGSFKRLFWEEQLRAARVKGSSGMHWHPLIVRWCLNLKLISSAEYTMPHVVLALLSFHLSVLYTHYFKSRAGFQLEVNQQLQKESKVSDLPENRL